jgi:hypothetical protein
MLIFATHKSSETRLFRLLMALGLIALFALGLRVSAALDGRESLAISGQILEAEVAEEWAWLPLGRRELRLQPQVLYTYFHEGLEYEGAHLRALDLPFLRSPAYQRSLVAGLQPGQQVTLYLDPSRPEASCLRIPVDWWLVSGYALLALTVLLAALCAGRLGVFTRPILTWAATGLGGGMLLLGARLTHLGDSPGLAAAGLLMILAGWVSRLRLARRIPLARRG